LVRDKRDERGISQAKIANLLNVTRGYIGQIETRSYSSMYKYDQLNKIAVYLECSPRDFIPKLAIEYD
jgi:transcriptional regulator with XRE-family HTH domain